jgi:hypothetical protein
VGDGDRTRDIRCHRPTLYQLSYAHQWINRGQFTLKRASIEIGGSPSGTGDLREPWTRIDSATYYLCSENAEIPGLLV